MTRGDWADRFAEAALLEPALRDALGRRASFVHLPAGATVFSPGQEAENLLFVLSGVVRVSHLAETGREVVLYRVGQGESCVMTTACLMAHEPYTAEGIAETEVEAMAIPAAVFDDLSARSAAVRKLVFGSYARRMLDLFRVIEDLAFGRIDMRLAQRLVALADASDEVRATHQQLSVELGTAREVVTRRLQDFQRQGWVHLSRGVIRLTDRAALARVGGGSPGHAPGTGRAHSGGGD